MRAWILVKCTTRVAFMFPVGLSAGFCLSTPIGSVHHVGALTFYDTVGLYISKSAVFRYTYYPILSPVILDDWPVGTTYLPLLGWNFNICSSSLWKLLLWIIYSVSSHSTCVTIYAMYLGIKSSIMLSMFLHIYLICCNYEAVWGVYYVTYFLWYLIIVIFGCYIFTLVL